MPCSVVSDNITLLDAWTLDEGDEWKNVGRREAILHRRRAVFPVVVCNFQEIKSSPLAQKLVVV